jgi:putative endonuclease
MAIRIKRCGYVYIMTNGPSVTLYIGVTADLAAGVAQHRSATGSDFCRRYGLKQLVYVEQHESIEEAIVREKRSRPGSGPGSRT